MGAPFEWGSGASTYEYRGRMRLMKGRKDEGALTVPSTPAPKAPTATPDAGGEA